MRKGTPSRAVHFAVHCTLFAVVALAAFPLMAEPCVPASLPPQKALKRGINLSGWWQGDRQQAVSATEMRKLRKLGFDFVRLPLTPGYLEEEDEAARAEKLQLLGCDMAGLLEAGFNVVLDLHAPESFKRELFSGTPEEALERLAELWRRAVPALKNLPASHVALSLFNEPRWDLPGGWWYMQGELIRYLRPVFPRHRLIVSAGATAGLYDLVRRKPYNDSNILYDFHFYTPMGFTHYGAAWRKNAPRLSEAEQWNRKMLAGEIQALVRWKRRYKVSVACLEFGVYRPFVEEGIRNRWLAEVRGLLEAAGIPWALWEYRGGFGLLRTGGELDEGVAKALALNHNPAP